MYLAIEGPTAVGKSTLAATLSQELGALLSSDPFERNPFLKSGSPASPITGSALLNEAAFLFLRIVELRGTIAPARSSGNDVVADWALWKQRVFGRLALDRWELRRLIATADLWATGLPMPTIYIVLTARDPQMLKDRCDRRGRDFEAGLDLAYFSHLVKLFDNEVRRLRSEGAKVLVRSIEGFDSTNPKHISAMIRDLQVASAAR